MEETTKRKVRIRRPSVKKSTKEQNKLTSNKLEVLITIVNRTKTDFYIDLIQSHGANMQFSMSAKGTADIAILKKLGISDTDKTVIFSVIKEEDSAKALATLDEKFRTIKNGNGIAYTVPMSSIIGVSVFAFLANERQGGLFNGTN